jgi:hypothetical protein
MERAGKNPLFVPGERDEQRESNEQREEKGGEAEWKE